MRFYKIYFIVGLALLTVTAAVAQRIPIPRLPIRIPVMAETDTTKKDSAAVQPPRSAIKSYATVLKDATTQKGLFSVHRKKDQVFFEIGDSLLNRELMVINRLSKGPASYGMYAGEELDEKTIRFEIGSDSTIRIRFVLVVNEADSSNEMYKAVVRSSVNPVVASFPIAAYGPEHKSYVIDVTKLLTDKSFVNNIDQGTALAKNVRSYSMKDFLIESIHTYPINVEISISKNLDAVTTSATGIPVTMESHTSFILLPKVPLQRRFFDQRVGYFADKYNAFSDDQQKVELKQFILRWRLEPKPEDAAAWKRGALVEPAKPIVIYIDPATPKQWRPYLVQGINDWQVAFEQAGFKNAIIGKEWPEADTTMQLEDARYSMINYLPSEVANAYGPQVHDPRSGEIIQTHIGWYHNVMQLLHSWYQVQAAAVDPEARKAKFDTVLMGKLIRFVSSHEVGHTLGLRHNFGSSSQTPVDSLRSRSYLHKYGHTASIMDYARFNYVAQPSDHIPQEDLFPRIGAYDKWAIEWGYKASFAANAEEDKRIVSGWIEKRVSKKERTWFGDGETQKIDPRCQTEDLGDNAMKASAYGIQNLQRILPNLPEWSHEEGGTNGNLSDMYKVLKDQYARYMGHVLKNIGGVYYTVRSETEAGDAYQPVTAATVKEVFSFFNTWLFTTPAWLMDKKVVNKVNAPVAPDFISDMQVRVLNSLLDIERLNKMLVNEHQFQGNTCSLEAYMDGLHALIWKELRTGSVITMDSYRRDLQKSYIGALLDIFTSKDSNVTETDVFSVVNADLRLLLKELNATAGKTTNHLNRMHLMDLKTRLKNALESKL